MEKNQLKAFVERIERLEEEKKSIADDIRDVYAEAKANGFDTKALRKIISLRKIDAAERREQEAILETYMHALGMLASTELGQAAMERYRSELVQQGREAFDGLQRAAADIAISVAPPDDAFAIPPELRRSHPPKATTKAEVNSDGPDGGPPPESHPVHKPQGDGVGSGIHGGGAG